MAIFWGTASQIGPGGISARARLMTRLAAVLVLAGLGWMVSLVPPSAPFRDPPIIQAIRLAPSEIPQKPELIPPELLPPKPLIASAQQSANAPSNPVQAPTIEAAQSPIAPVQTIDRPSPVLLPPSASLPALQSGPLPRMARRPSTPIGSTGPSGPTPQLTRESQAIIHAQACLQIDMKDRPADCPPNAVLKRLLEQARGPQYRPENAQGFTRGEVMARDIPPPCLDDGDNFKLSGGKLCMRIGVPPSRVRSPKEICEARGLGSCIDPPPQSAVDAAVKVTKGRQ